MLSYLNIKKLHEVHKNDDVINNQTNPDQETKGSRKLLSPAQQQKTKDPALNFDMDNTVYVGT